MSEPKIDSAVDEKPKVEQAAVKETVDGLDKTSKRPREEAQDKEEEETIGKSELSNDDDEKKNKKEEDDEEESSHKKTKTDDTKTVDKQSSEDAGRVDDEERKDKFVFGAASNFGTGFGVAKGDTQNEKSTNTKSSSASDATTKKPFAFGSGLSFGSGFNILKSKNDNDSEDAKKVADDKEEVNSESEQRTKASEEPRDAAKPLKLQKQDIKSGEESEECIYQVNAKLYQLSKIEEGWKERGVGVIKVNKSKKDEEKTRIVMRSRGILKVILNIQLVKGFTVQKGFTGSLQSEKFIRLLALDDNGDPAQYAIKTGKKETTDELYNTIVKSVPK
ncbi:hypothetical protein N7582_002984 [Saccharomyces uvarum]|uniref:RanBD1 domain-containing protein n=1 Tax=Saccharomyces uvarum TaxID=230603 RepID=A0AA35JMZ1_SACUV|nr:hypothetical protein N7582_002984 [Saccharomyces uvarum]CAI4065372.1 hypothetical protein SUVC_09G1070 [Saccharomyces uvarum]